jgi:putative nucleotidyltransferase with HDIG domain
MNDVQVVVDRLPSLPGNGAAILGSLLSPEPDLGDVERVVKQDEGLSTAVLRRANSVAFGSPGRTFDIGQSVRRLGRRPLIRVALEQQMTETLTGAGHAYGLRRQDAWTGALFGAVAAEIIAQDMGDVEPGLAFTAALLRDIGKLAVDAMMSPDEAARLGATGDGTQSFLELERDRLGADHAEIGAMLARRWDLPEVVAAAIAAHHSPAPPEDAERHSPLHDVVHAADTMGLWAGVATGHDGLRYPLAPHVQERVLRNNRRVERIMADAWDRFREMTGADQDAATDGAGDGSTARSVA